MTLALTIYAMVESEVQSWCIAWLILQGWPKIPGKAKGSSLPKSGKAIAYIEPDNVDRNSSGWNRELHLELSLSAVTRENETR